MRVDLNWLSRYVRPSQTENEKRVPMQGTSRPSSVPTCPTGTIEGQ